MGNSETPEFKYPTNMRNKPVVDMRPITHQGITVGTLYIFLDRQGDVILNREYAYLLSMAKRTWGQLNYLEIKVRED